MSAADRIAAALTALKDVAAPWHSAPNPVYVCNAREQVVVRAIEPPHNTLILAAPDLAQRVIDLETAVRALLRDRGLACQGPVRSVDRRQDISFVRGAATCEGRPTHAANVESSSGRWLCGPCAETARAAGASIMELRHADATRTLFDLLTWPTQDP